MLNLNHKDLCKGIQSTEIDAVWDIAAPLIQKALDQGSDYDIDDIYEGLKSQKMQLWMWRDVAALVTTIQTKKRKKFCLLLALGGESMSLWLQYLPWLEAWAKDKGAKEMRIYGRIGWSKAIGYEIEYAAMSKSL